MDFKILHRLQADGRVTNADLADELNMSPATCHRRTQTLFRSGFVRGVRALVDPAKVQRGALVLVGAVLDRSTPESFAAFEAAILKLELVLDCHLVAGEFDYIIKLRVRDIAAFNQLHSDMLLSLPGVRQIRSFFVLKEVIDNAPLSF
jgi:Lrp/AsnC family leucine-responsive transcriptional regulator